MKNIKTATVVRCSKAGLDFEQSVIRRLYRAFPNIHISHDIVLSSSVKLVKETQIDLVCVLSGIVFVVEVKGWRGSMSGSYTDWVWDCTNAGGATKNIVSPVVQNFLHERLLRNGFRNGGQPLPKFFNYIVVPEETLILSKCKEIVSESMLIEKMRKDIENATSLSGEETKRFIEFITKI